MPNATDTSNVVPFMTPTDDNRDSRSDLTVFEPYLDRFCLTPAQRHELLKVLWTILVGFVDFGYGIHPTQYRESNDLDEEIIRTVDKYFKDAA